MGRIEDMAQRVGQIATAAEEQSSAAEEISSGIEDIAAIAKEADESASQTRRPRTTWRSCPRPACNLVTASSMVML